MSEATDLQRAVETLTGSIESLRQELVRKDVYASDQRARDVQIEGIRSSVSSEIAAVRDEGRALGTRMDTADERRANDRRLIFVAFLAPLALLLLNLYITAQGGR